MAWQAYREMDAMVYSVPHEWETSQYLFEADPGRGHIIPYGLEAVTLAALREPQPEGDYLVSIATIAPRKNTVLLAQAARGAQVPVVFLGKPYSPNDQYFLRFKQLVDERWVRYPGFVTEREKQRYLRGARGFVLFSQFESGCIAVYEAAAAGLPLCLAELPWATKVYGQTRRRQFVSVSSSDAVGEELKRFYRTAHRQVEPTFPILSWSEVAGKYVALYRDVLSRRNGYESSSANSP